MSPRKVIPVENGALSPIAERVLNVRSLTHEHSHDGIVIAVQAELVVRPGALSAAGPQGAGAGGGTRWESRRRCVAPRTKLVRSARQTGQKGRRRTTSPTRTARSARSRSGG